MRKILIADDSVFQRKTLSDLVTRLGYSYDTVSSGDELLTKNYQSYDCIFLDLLMPGLSGIEVLERLNEQNDSPPVIVISADVQTKRRERCMELGAAAFITKLVDETELTETLNGIFQN
jgi:CheY-like chemotaxis protein